MYHPRRNQRNGDDETVIGNGVKGLLSTHLDCQILPHGFYPLIPTILSSMALWTSTVQDGCDYGRLLGDASISKITGSDVFPFLEVGLYNYRAPIFYASENDWRLAFTYECQEYPPEVVDTWWNIGRYLTMISSVFAGSLCLFLWFTTCVSLSKRTWKFCSVVAFLAAIFRSGSFFFFSSSICNGIGSECHLAFGSKVDVLGIILWLVAGFTICGHYPDPKLRRAHEYGDVDVEASEEFNNLRPKPLTVSSQPSSIKRSLSSRLFKNVSSAAWDCFCSLSWH